MKKIDRHMEKAWVVVWGVFTELRFG